MRSRSDTGPTTPSNKPPSKHPRTQGPKGPQDMAREILSILPDVVVILPADEIRGHLNTLESFLV
jgi:hypothetical protein